MRLEKNIQEVISLSPEYLGFIFYKKSKRYVGDTFPSQILQNIPKNIKKVGVFVNANIDYIFSQVSHYQLDIIQLHGDENLDFCEAIKSPTLRGARDISPEVKTIKAFSVGDDFDFQLLEAYQYHCDYFLFDTKGKNYGGNGESFDWQIIQKYPYKIPFFMSGGISLDNLKDLLNFIEENKELPFWAIDVNSRFEDEPALKNIEKLQKMFTIITEKR